MIIQFLCPNGHKIHCPEERAGQAAKCPKCSVRFRIPSPGGAGVSSLLNGAAGDSGDLSGRPASGVALGSAATGDQIEFLCPNNHLLHGPASLQGRPGQCPECSSKFRIPVYEEEPGFDQEKTRPRIPVSDLRDLKPSGPISEDMPTSLQLQESGLPGPLLAPHGLLGLFSHLWGYKSQGSPLEIRYGDGQRLTPDSFIKGLSHGSHAVFAVAESNGSHTITAVAWDSISAIVVKGVKKLPDELLG